MLSTIQTENKRTILKGKGGPKSLKKTTDTTYEREFDKIFMPGKSLAHDFLKVYIIAKIS